jgi:hypothetical protein
VISAGAGVAVAVALAGCSASAPPAATPGATCGGAIVIAAQADVARLAGCTTVRSLVVRTGAAIDLGKLGTLREVAGDVTIGPTVAMPEIQLPAVERIAGVLRITVNGSASGVFLPELRAVGGIAIVDNPAITIVAMPMLAAVGGDLVVRNNAALEVILAPSLQNVVGTLAVTGVPHLATVDLGAVPPTW